MNSFSCAQIELVCFFLPVLGEPGDLEVEELPLRRHHDLVHVVVTDVHLHLRDKKHIFSEWNGLSTVGLSTRYVWNFG